MKNFTGKTLVAIIITILITILIFVSNLFSEEFAYFFALLQFIFIFPFFIILALSIISFIFLRKFRIFIFSKYFIIVVFTFILGAMLLDKIYWEYIYEWQKKSIINYSINGQGFEFSEEVEKFKNEYGKYPTDLEVEGFQSYIKINEQGKVCGKKVIVDYLGNGNYSFHFEIDGLGGMIFTGCGHNIYVRKNNSDINQDNNGLGNGWSYKEDYTCM